MDKIKCHSLRGCLSFEDGMPIEIHSKWLWKKFTTIFFFPSNQNYSKKIYTAVKRREVSNKMFNEA